MDWQGAFTYISNVGKINFKNYSIEHNINQYVSQKVENIIFIINY